MLHYSHLTDYYFVPIAMETFGSWAKKSLEFMKKLGDQLKLATGEPKSTYYLLQRISILVQRSNASSILGSFGPEVNLEEVFYL